MSGQRAFLERRPRDGRRGTTAVIAGALALWPLGAFAHGFAGKRFFPSTLAIEDPFVNEEFSLIVAHIKEPGEGDEPPILATEIEAEYAKTIFPSFAISLSGTATTILTPTGTRRTETAPATWR